jgi:hypothetical protein
MVRRSGFHLTFYLQFYRSEPTLSDALAAKRSAELPLGYSG